MHRSLVLAVLLMTLLGCRGPATTTASLRVAVLPILDSLPFYVAEAEGYYAEENLVVELVPVSSAAERDQLLQAGQVDVLITDLVALLLVDRGQIDLVAVRYAMVPTAEVAQFSVLASPGSGIAGVGDLAGRSVGISEGTVIEYVTDRLLEAEGLPPDQIRTLAVPRISDRMALLAAGELPAATLPEPLGTLAMQQGAQLIVDDTAHPEYSCSIVAVRADLTEDQSDSIRALLRAVNRAVGAINTDKDAWSQLLDERRILPPSIGIGYELPDYPAPNLPSEAQVADVAVWLRKEGLINESPTYDQIVRPGFLE